MRRAKQSVSQSTYSAALHILFAYIGGICAYRKKQRNGQVAEASCSSTAVHVTNNDNDENINQQLSL